MALWPDKFGSRFTIRLVRFIYLGRGVLLAGERPGRFFYHHRLIEAVPAQCLTVHNQKRLFALQVLFHCDLNLNTVWPTVVLRNDAKPLPYLWVKR